MSKISKPIDYLEHQKQQNNIELANEKKSKLHFKQTQNLISPEDAMNELQQLQITDNKLSNLDAKEELSQQLRKFINNQYFIDKIIKSRNLSPEIQNQLALNFETAVQPRLQAISSFKNISIDKIILLLEQIGKQLLSNTIGLQLSDQLGEFKDVLTDQYKEHGKTIGEKNIISLREGLADLNKEIFAQANGIDNLIKSKEKPTKKDLCKWIGEIAKIDRCYVNFLYAKDNVANVQKDEFEKTFMEDSNITAEVKKISYLTNAQLQNILQNYYNQCLTYDKVSFKQIKDVYEKRNVDLNIVEQPQNDNNDYNEFFNPLLQQLTTPQRYLQTTVDKGNEDEDLPPLEDANDQKQGEGLKFNSKNNNLQANEKLIHPKYYINTKKLGGSILDIRYLKTRHLTPIKQQFLSPEMKNMVHHLIGGKVDKAGYENLTHIDKHLYRSLLPYFGKDKDAVDDLDAFYERFNVIRGELASGNDSHALKRECLAYLNHAMNIGLIKRQTYNQMRLDLNL